MFLRHSVRIINEEVTEPITLAAGARWLAVAMATLFSSSSLAVNSKAT